MRISDWSSNVCSSDLRDGEIDADDEPKLFERFSASTVIDVSGNWPFRKWIVYMPSGMARWPNGAFAAGRPRFCTDAVLTLHAHELALNVNCRVILIHAHTGTRAHVRVNQGGTS